MKEEKDWNNGFKWGMIAGIVSVCIIILFKINLW